MSIDRRWTREGEREWGEAVAMQKMRGGQEAR